jgi:hypothetical protein
VIAAQCLERQIGIQHLVVGIGIEKLDRLVVEHLAQQCGDGFALVEPLPPQLGQGLRRLGLVEGDEARHPAIGEILVVQRIENPRVGHAGKAQHGDAAQMLVAEHRLDPAAQGRVG